MNNLDIRGILMSILVLSISLSTHEYAHARMAYQLGDDTAKKAGRMTLNPLAHLDPLGTLAFIFARVGWAKPVPVSYSRLTKAKNMKQGVMLVSLAGPAANLLLSFVGAFLLNFYVVLLELFMANPSSMSAGQYQIHSLLLYFLYFFHKSNIYLAIFNLLPLPPLDGSKIAAYLLPDKYYIRLAKYERYIGLLVFALFIFAGKYLTQVMNFLAKPFYYILMYPWEAIAKLVLTFFKG